MHQCLLRLSHGLILPPILRTLKLTVQATKEEDDAEVDVAALMGFGAFGTKKVVKEKKEKVKEMRASDVAQERRRCANVCMCMC